MRISLKQQFANSFKQKLRLQHLSGSDSILQKLDVKLANRGSVLFYNRNKTKILFYSSLC